MNLRVLTSNAIALGKQLTLKIYAVRKISHRGFYEVELKKINKGISITFFFETIASLLSLIHIIELTQQVELLPTIEIFHNTVQQTKKRKREDTLDYIVIDGTTTDVIIHEEHLKVSVKSYLQLASYIASLIGSNNCKLQYTVDRTRYRIIDDLTLQTFWRLNLKKIPKAAIEVDTPVSFPPHNNGNNENNNNNTNTSSNQGVSHIVDNPPEESDSSSSLDGFSDYSDSLSETDSCTETDSCAETDSNYDSEAATGYFIKVTFNFCTCLVSVYDGPELAKWISSFIPSTPFKLRVFGGPPIPLVFVETVFSLLHHLEY